MWQEAKDRGAWNELVGNQQHARFLQSWQWGEFQESLGRKVLRLSWRDELMAQAIRMQFPGGFFYWYVPHGPVVVREAEHIYSALASFEERLGGAGALFSRIDPVRRFLPSSEKEERMRNTRPLWFVPATQPQCTSILDLSKTEGELLAAMHQKTRYNIRVAERKGVVIGEGSVEDFLRLNRETKERGKFTPHPDAYYQKMVDALPEDFIATWQATYRGAPVASALVISFGDTATYAHGASSNEHREIMAPYLLHWEIMQDAKKRGVHYYDLGGVNPDDRTHAAYKKSWEGITRFKG